VLDSTAGFGTETPCGLDTTQIGQIVEVAGEIAFLDDMDPEGIYADLEAEGCRVGLWMERRNLATWFPESDEPIVVGAQVLVSGQLTEQSLPARPEEKQLVIEVTSMPRLLGPPINAELWEDSRLPPLKGPACSVSESELWRDTAVTGVIRFVDDSKAAGIYGELETDGCFMRLWVERTRWDTWNDGDKQMFSAGIEVGVSGIMTKVLGEPTLDLSLPPEAH